MDKKLTRRLDDIAVVVQIAAERPHIVTAGAVVVLLQKEKSLMAQHVAWELFCCLIEDVVKRDIVERMHPLVGIFSRAELQGDFCLDILAAQIHVAVHVARKAGI